MEKGVNTKPWQHSTGVIILQGSKKVAFELSLNGKRWGFRYEMPY